MVGDKVSVHINRIKYRFGGLLVEVTASVPFQELAICHEFRVRTDQPAALTIHLQPAERIEKPRESVFLDDLNKWIVDGRDGHAATVYKCSRRNPHDEPLFCASIDAAHRTARITYLQDNTNVEQEVLHFIGRILLRNALVLNRGGMIHASAIAWKQSGLLFTAPSGTGKSTQADLWVAAKRAVILNDDSPVFRLMDERVLIYGTPWSGSRTIYARQEAPLKAIFVLEQRVFNTISRLKPEEAVPRLLPRCYLPYYDQRLMDLACATLEELVHRTPVFLFGCTPDRDAVEAVCRCIEALP